MMANTHFLISKHVYYSLDIKDREKISYNGFLYGNVKPDMASKYKLKKHYMDESFDMIINKIKILSSLSDKELNKTGAKIRFSQELGVVCHFLCDFFCVPHSQRWEFKHSMNKHIRYENELAKVAKSFEFSDDRAKVFSYYSIEQFILDTHKIYSKIDSYDNDLFFANYICNSVVQYVADSIEFNSSIVTNFSRKYI